MNTLSTHLHRVQVIGSLPPDLQDLIDRNTEEKSFRRRQMVFMSDHVNDYIYLLAFGRVKLTRVSAMGREMTLAVIDPLELFGEDHIFDAGKQYGVNAEVLEDSQVLAIKRTTLATVLEQNPAALIELTALQSARRRLAENSLTEYVFYDVPTRVARLLYRLAEKYGRATRNGTVLRVKLTHQEIANLVGTTRETTTVILSDFKKRNIIDLQGRRIVITDANALDDVVG